VTRELHAVSYNPIRGNIVQYTVTGVDGKVRRTVDIRMRAQTMMHDFSLTEKYVVLYDLPVARGIRHAVEEQAAKAVAGLLTRFAERHAAPDFFLRAAMRGSDRGGASPSGMPYPLGNRSGRPVSGAAARGHCGRHPWFDVNACYVFHPLNAYDEPIASLGRREAPVGGSLRAIPSCPANPTLDRWTVDLTARKVTEERLDDTGQEFPRVDERLVGRPHRYGYAVGLLP